MYKEAIELLKDRYPNDLWISYTELKSQKVLFFLKQMIGLDLISDADAKRVLIKEDINLLGKLISDYIHYNETHPRNNKDLFIIWRFRNPESIKLPIQDLIQSNRYAIGEIIKKIKEWLPTPQEQEAYEQYQWDKADAEGISRYEVENNINFED